MHTYREIVFILMDEMKIFSDDSSWENEHFIHIINKQRALLFNQKYKGKKVEIPFAWYQRLNVNFTYPSIGSNIYKSTKKIPPILDTTNLWQYTFISTDGANTPNLNFINPQRFKTCGYNKWTSNELYGTIDLDNYMYLKSNNDKYIDVSQKTISTTVKTIKYGRLYNRYATVDPRRLAPIGWHVPTIDEWNILFNFVGGENISGKRLKQAGHSTWAEYNDIVGTDDYSFTSLPGGGWQGIFPLGYYSTYITSTAIDLLTSYFVSMTYNLDSANTTTGNNSSQSSIRLVKDNPINEGPLIIDGDNYNTITIGSQVWLQQNLSVTHYQNGDSIGLDFGGTDGAVAAYNNDEDNVYNIGNVTQSFPIVTGNILYDVILDNPIDADRFNDTNTLDVLDLEFPCEESLIQPIIDLCLKEIGVINNITRDTTNNASDDASLPKQQ